jgi:DNA-binding protein HU-beta
LKQNSKKAGIYAGLFCENWLRALAFPLFARLLGCGGPEYTYSAPGLQMSRFIPEERDGNMNKNELVSAVAEKAGITKADAASAVDAVFEAVQGELKNGGDVRLAGFGSFTVSHRAASKGRNPSTGAEVDIAARNVPKFTPGKGLKEAVNG